MADQTDLKIMAFANGGWWCAAFGRRLVIDSQLSIDYLKFKPNGEARKNDSRMNTDVNVCVCHTTILLSLEVTQC